jgi:hypothetical protein
MQHEDLRTILLSTGDVWLIEHTKNDTQWADGNDGRGTNYLGKLLMFLREYLLTGKECLPPNEFLKAPMSSFVDYTQKV